MSAAKKPAPQQLRYSMSQAAQALGIGRSSLYRMVEAGKITTTRLAGDGAQGVLLTELQRVAAGLPK